MINYSKYCKYKQLSNEEQIDLFKEIEQCKLNGNIKRITELNNKIVCSYIPFVIQSIQKHKTNTNIDLDDLLHEGILGLYYALNKFEYKRNNKFSTYAKPWVNLKVQLAIKNYYSIDVSPHFIRKYKKYKEMETKLKNELGLEFTVQNYPISYISLQKEIGPNDGNKHQCLEDVIIDHNAKNPGVVFEEQDTLEYIEKVIKTLKDDEQYIIRNRYGFDGDKKTLDEIATTLNLSRERIFAKEKEILHKLSYRVKINA